MSAKKLSHDVSVKTPRIAPTLTMLEVDKQSFQPAVFSCSNKMSMEGTQKNGMIMNFVVDSNNASKQK